MPLYLIFLLLLRIFAIALMDVEKEGGKCSTIDETKYQIRWSLAVGVYICTGDLTSYKQQAALSNLSLLHNTSELSTSIHTATSSLAHYQFTINQE